MQCKKKNGTINVAMRCNKNYAQKNAAMRCYKKKMDKKCCDAMRNGRQNRNNKRNAIQKEMRQKLQYNTTGNARKNAMQYKKATKKSATR